MHNFISFHYHLLLTIIDSDIIIFTVLQKANNYNIVGLGNVPSHLYGIFSHIKLKWTASSFLCTLTEIYAFSKIITGNFIIILVMEILYMYLPPSVKRNDFNEKCMCHLFRWELSLFTPSAVHLYFQMIFFSSSVFVYVSITEEHIVLVYFYTMQY